MAVVELGVPPERVNTSIDWGTLVTYPIKAVGSLYAANAGVLSELAGLVAQGGLEIPRARS